MEIGRGGRDRKAARGRGRREAGWKRTSKGKERGLSQRCMVGLEGGGMDG